MILRKFKLKSGVFAINGLYAPEEYDELLNFMNKRIENNDVYSEEYKKIIAEITRSTQTANDFDIKNGAEKDWKTFVIYNEHILEFVYLALRMPIEMEKNKLELEMKDQMLDIQEKNHKELVDYITNDSIMQIRRLVNKLNTQDEIIKNMKEA